MSRRYAGVADPTVSGAGCWVKLWTSYGALFQGEQFCGNRARPGKLTCRSHDCHEDAARRERDRLRGKKSEGCGTDAV